MWPADLVKGTTSFTIASPYLPFMSSMLAYRGQQATLAKSLPGRAPVGGSTVPLPTMSTKCFATVAPYFEPGAPNLPGSCFPRYGTAIRAPGAKQYGRTARLLGNTTSVGTSVGTTGLSNFAVNFYYASTPN